MSLNTFPLSTLHKAVGAALAVLASLPVAAQVAPASPASAVSPGPSEPARAVVPSASASAPRPEARLPAVVITGNPLGATELSQPVTVLDGDALSLRKSTTLGETLDGLPGVSSTRFGPNSSRPIIRGLDGDRVRVLSNSGATIDASSLSFDHAVAIDPLAVERVEVLRGPAALLYGGSAVGGVVNTIDNRIPKSKVDSTTGSAEARVGGAEGERSVGGLIETGNGRFALHVDVFGRETSDLRVPTYTPIVDGTALAATRTLRNSASKASGGSIGGSLTFDHGYLGLSVDTYDNKYGVVAEPDVTIKMKRDHYALAGEIRNLGGLIRTVRGRFGMTDYRHDEIEGSGAVGTTFLSKGNDLRIEAEHAPLGPVRGVVGVQLETLKFSALGEEAFVPFTRTDSQAIFVLEELQSSLGTTSLGLRSERVKVKSAGDADPADSRFGEANDRRFSLGSASLAHIVPLATQWQLTGTLSATERAPTYYELFANGLHVATGAYETGNPALRKERGNHGELALKWKVGASSARVGVYETRFSRFIALDATGANVAQIDEAGNPSAVPEYAFRSVRARLRGVELEGTHRVHVQQWTVDAFSRLDLTRATNLDTGEPLARIAPMRITVGAEAASQGWTARAELQHVARQARVPSTDTATAGYSIVNLSIAKRLKLGPTDALFFAKLTNLGNELAYSATTIQTVRGLAPLAGRALRVGMRVDF